MTEKIILLLVEGPTDKDALALIFSRLVKEQAKNLNRLVRRNISKRAIVFRLMQTLEVAGFPYEIYYFSRNLEHVLHNLPQELTDEEKEDLAYEIADYYSGQPEEFVNFLYNPEFHVDGNYEETWKFIMKNGNSLKRYCNMAIFFERLGIEC